MDLGVPGCTDAEIVGKGGFGSVYRCRQPDLNRTVAVKVFNLSHADADDIAAFERECAAIGQLDWCPNIVTVFQAGRTASGDPYLVMEFAPGKSLADRIKETGGLDESAARRIGERIASALAVAHEAEILHRDVKPANILISRTGEPLLADFGIAKLAGGSRTSTGSITGSLGFCAPEVLEGNGASPQTDVYSLGATLFAMLTGHGPFARTGSDTMTDLIVRTLTGPIPDLSDLGVSDSFTAIIRRCLSRDPAQRFRSATDLADALAEGVKPANIKEKVADRWAAEFYCTDAHAVTATEISSGPWPTAIEYVQSIQVQPTPIPAGGFDSARIVRDSLGMPGSASGQTAIVFELSSDLGPLALRCFTRAPGDGAVRYRELGRHLTDNPCSSIAPAVWLESALEVSGRKWPAVVMPWVPGVPLNIAVEDMLDRPEGLAALAEAWSCAVAALVRAQVAHGDLQSGNVIVDPSGAVRLVDLDGVYVPSLQNPPDEFGHPNFQHPKRTALSWGPDVDAFSIVVIALSLRALAADPQLWTHNSGENLILSKDDYLAPGATSTWQELASSADTEVVRLAGVLIDYCRAKTPPTLGSALGALGIEFPQVRQGALATGRLHDEAAVTRNRSSLLADSDTAYASEPETQRRTAGPTADVDEQWWSDAVSSESPTATVSEPARTLVVGPSESSAQPSAPPSGRPTGVPGGRGFARFLIRNSVVTGISAGLLAALATVWIFAIVSPSPKPRAAVLLLLVGALLSGILASLPSFALRSWGRAVLTLFGGAVLGAALSVGSLVLFNSVTTFHSGPAPVQQMVLAWGGAGVAVGLAAGVARLSVRATVGGIAGGIAGGALSGLAYSASSPRYVNYHNVVLLDLRLSSGTIIGLLAACAVIGLVIGAADRISRRAWLTVMEGPMRGSEITVDRRTISVGSGLSDTLRFSGDPKVVESHLVITLAEEPKVLARGPVEVNGMQHAAGTLLAMQSGDVIRVGGSFLRLRLKGGS